MKLLGFGSLLAKQDWVDKGTRGQGDKEKNPNLSPRLPVSCLPVSCLPVSCLVSLVITTLLLSFAAAQEVILEQQVFEIARQLRCPVCVSESVADSSAEISVQMRDIIQEQLEQGKSPQEILAFFQERYGDWILLNPPKRGLHLLVWILPLLVALLGLGLLSLFFQRWTRASKQSIEVDEAELERVREALKQGN
jgi:cytochrome c-type biogenesis protein CcmH